MAFLIFFVPTKGYADDGDEEIPFDEISVFLNVQGIGGSELPALIKGQSAYLSITELFNFLKIRNIADADKGIISGFFIDQQAVYLIDFPKNRIEYQGKTFDLSREDLIREQDNLYLKTSVFGKVFALNCIFNFRNLSVDLSTRLELPVIRELRQETMRQNVGTLKGEFKADTTLSRDYPLFHVGMADWSVITSRETVAGNDTRLNLNMGGIVAGGETNIMLNYSSNEPFTERQQFYQWRFADNDRRYLKQTTIGKIFSQATSSIYAPILGVQLTNAPTTYRRSFGTYNLNNRTEPGWMVELYVNNVLVDYKKADPSGFYSFDVPLVYGNSEVKVRFYGPFGEEQTSQQNISIPFNFLPVKEFEYNLSAGIVEDGLNTKYSRLMMNYGLNKRMTIGGGMEYLSSLGNSKNIPFINTSLRLSSNLLVTSQYDYNVRLKNILTYRLPANMQLEMNYIRYKEGQQAINHNFLEERKLMLSMPVRAAGLSFFSRMSFNQIILPLTSYSTAEWLVSGVVKGVSTTVNTYVLTNDFSEPNVYSNISMSMRMPKGIIFTPQAQYKYRQNELISLRLGLEKNLLKHGFLNLSYEENFQSSYRNLSLGFRYDFAFAQTAFQSRRGNTGTSLMQSARGSLILDKKIGYLGVNNRTSVGRGGMIITTFLDLNENGKREDGEPKVSGLKFRINGGRIENSKKDTTLRIFDLEPYTGYMLELDSASLDNISWRVAKKSLKVAINPNQLKLIEIPVSVIGEVSGYIYLKEKDSLKGLGRMIVNIYNAQEDLAGRTLTESDGYYSYLGLPSGDYTAEVDTSQMNKLGMISSAARASFQIINTEEGDIEENIDFTLKDPKPVIVDVEVKTYNKLEEGNSPEEVVENLIEQKEPQRILRLNQSLRRKDTPINQSRSGLKDNKTISPKAESLIIYPVKKSKVVFGTGLFDNPASYFNPRITLINGVWVYVIHSYRTYR